jgi:preprotein translocase subunit SecG
MTILLTIIHIIVCFFLIGIVLLQGGKGAELGAAFGGSSQTIFGSRGAATVFSKITTIAAVVFMITSLTLAVITAKGGSVVKKSPVTEERQSVPPVPAPMQGGGLQPSQTPAPAQPQGQQTAPATNK